MDINKIRNETRHCNEVIHFNNAGAALPPSIVNEKIIQYLEEEERLGGYELVDRYREDLIQVYNEAGKLIGATPEEIALTDNASTAFRKAIFSIPFKKEDEILTSEMEYGNNFLNYLKLKALYGIKITVIPNNSLGTIDLEKLKNNITDKTKLIAITHMPTNCGAIAPVEEIGKISKENGLLYLIDSCQSIGHYPLDVEKLHCDFLTATSRKYLRGPRGLGFLYVRKELHDKVEPIDIETDGAEWIDYNTYRSFQNAKMFEAYEKPFAMIYGFVEALKYANVLGIDNIWKRIQELSGYMRSQLRKLENIHIHDGSGPLSGIISITKDGLTPTELHQRLLKNGINSSVASWGTAMSDLKNKNLKTANRLSIHYYNTKDEIDQVVKFLKVMKF